MPFQLCWVFTQYKNAGQMQGGAISFVNAEPFHKPSMNRPSPYWIVAHLHLRQNSSAEGNDRTV